MTSHLILAFISERVLTLPCLIEVVPVSVIFLIDMLRRSKPEEGRSRCNHKGWKGVEGGWHDEWFASRCSKSPSIVVLYPFKVFAASVEARMTIVEKV